MLSGGFGFRIGGGGSLGFPRISTKPRTKLLDGPYPRRAPNLRVKGHRARACSTHFKVCELPDSAVGCVTLSKYGHVWGFCYTLQTDQGLTHVSYIKCEDACTTNQFETFRFRSRFDTCFLSASVRRDPSCLFPRTVVCTQNVHRPRTESTFYLLGWPTQGMHINLLVCLGS